MKKILTILLLTVIVASMFMVGCGEKEKEPIKISDLNWGSAHFQSEMAKIIIEEGYGYPVELIPGATIPLFQGTRTGDLDVFLEGWLQNQQEAYDKAIAAGDIVLLGFLNNDNWQSGFVVPTYVIKGDPDRGIEPMAPNLKSVFDLDQPEFKELFQNPENRSKGMLVNGPVGWECEMVTIEQVAAYGLDDDYDVINAGSQEGLFASLAGAYGKGEPWLGYLWGPTWIAGKFDLTLLEEPAHDQAVWEEDNACAWPSVDLFIAGHKDFPDKAPEVAEMFGKWKLSTATLNETLAYMDETGGEPIDAAVWFLQEREDLWTPFVPADVAKKVKEAVAQM
ncbi:MAG TPA: glycine betaine ABC transporter substrate-binding protein [Dehalococcoidales bacterium]|nr:glycine betaine ABC transporter substrate-binding protein [Dehalococcoidales bacterium]